MNLGILQQSQIPFTSEASKSLKPILTALGATGATMRLDAKTLPLVDGDDVTSWPEAYGGQGVVGITKFPILHREANGAPYVTFQSANYDFLYNTMDRSMPHTVMIVARFRTVPTALKPLVGHADQGPVTLLGVTGDGKVRVHAGASLDVSVAIDTEYHVFLGVFNGANSVVRMDSVEALGNAGANVNNRFSLARYGTEFADIDVKTSAVWPRVLTKTERDSVVASARAAYGI